MQEYFESDLSKKSSDSADHISRTTNKCPHCKEDLLQEYLDQNPFPEIPCPSCGTLIKSSSLLTKETPVENQRFDKRCDARLKVEYLSYDKFIIEYTKNVSKGGMFIGTKSKLDVGTMVDIALHIPGLDKPLTISCKVVHAKRFNVSEEDQGVGVKFIDIDAESRVKLIEFMKNQRNCS
ncbi:MAG: TIGR02266 family protein [Nitrospiraceae bacterium]|nr:MAG: TIGR02266 family protein [Nitrospiraceae bacterium]